MKNKQSIDNIIIGTFRNALTGFANIREGLNKENCSDSLKDLVGWQYFSIVNLLLRYVLENGSDDDQEEVVKILNILCILGKDQFDANVAFKGIDLKNFKIKNDKEYLYTPKQDEDC